MQTVQSGVGDVRRLADAQRAAAMIADNYVGLPVGVSKAMLVDRFERSASRLDIGEGVVRLVRTLVRLTYEQDWEGRYRPLAWPSNDQLGQELDRSRTAVQGLIRAAVRSGLVLMRDSGNGKRYGVRGEGGEIVDGYGFDLSPLAVRYEEFADLAAARTVEQAERRRLRRRVGELRREVRTLCADAMEREFEGFPWAAAVVQASGRLARSPDLATLRGLVGEASELLDAVDRAWLEARSGNDVREESEPRGSFNGAHIEPTTQPKSRRDTYNSSEEEVAAGGGAPAGSHVEADEAVCEEVLPLSFVLEAVPEMGRFLDDAEHCDWADFIGAAYQAALRLGINLSAWREAKEGMGERRAAIAVATVLARFLDGEINRSAGGYLRAMSERQRAGALHLVPSLYGLRARHRPKEGGQSPGA